MYGAPSRVLDGSSQTQVSFREHEKFTDKSSRTELTGEGL